MAGHSIGEGAKNKVGPELKGLDGRKSGTAPDYSYSDANKNAGIPWNEAQFKEYIKDPKAKIPGTKMAFAGIKNDKEVNDLRVFISQYDKDGTDAELSSARGSAPPPRCWRSRRRSPCSSRQHLLHPRLRRLHVSACRRAVPGCRQ